MNRQQGVARNYPKKRRKGNTSYVCFKHLYPSVYICHGIVGRVNPFQLLKLSYYNFSSALSPYRECGAKRGTSSILKIRFWAKYTDNALKLETHFVGNIYLELVIGRGSGALKEEPQNI